MEEIIDHRKIDQVIKSGEAYIVDRKSGTKQRKFTIKLKDMKNGYPVQTANCAIKNNLRKDLAFEWWVNYAMEKANMSIPKLKSKH